MSRVPACFAIAIVIALCGSTAHAALTMQVDFDVHHELVPKGSATLPPDSHRSTTVTLEARRVVVAGSDATTVYDATRRRDVVDNKSRTRVDHSLYDVPAFRTIEYRRVGLSRAMAVAKIDDGTTAVDLEQNLGFQEPSSPLQVAEDGVDRTFSGPTRVFCRISLAATVVKADEARMFVQMLRHAIAVHPQVLAGIASANAIPERMVAVSRQFSEETQTVTVRSIHETADAPIDASTIPRRRATASSQPIDRALDRATALDAADVSRTLARARDEIAVALRDGRLLDAMLGIIEWGLTSGEPLVWATPEQRARVGADAAVASLSRALAATTKDETTAALPVLEGLHSQAATKAYVLDIFIANDRKTLGQPVVARDLLLNVLAVNPLIAGVYKDLGDCELMQFDTVRAWRAWDSGRRLFPRFANFTAVDRFEQSLLSEHPEYF